MPRQKTMLESSPRLNGRLFARKFTVRVGELRAAMLFASDDETRHVLNGVLIEVKPGKRPLMVATDGRRLAALETVADQGEDFAETEFSLILSTQFLKPLTGFAKGFGAEIVFDYHPPERIVAEFIGGHCFVDSEQGALIQGEFPTWRKCLPVGQKRRVPHIGVNAEFISDFAKAAKFLDVETPIINVNLIGENEGMDIKIPARPSFYGVLMPAKVDEDQEWQPEFLELIGFKEEKPLVEPEDAETKP